MPVMNKPLLSVLNGHVIDKVPFWLMRQAGRYLPEYRAVREKAGGFLNLVFDPDLASEVTIQPLRRFGMDGAILFSDILIVPLALGQDLRFETGEGPVLTPVRSVADLGALDISRFDDIVAPIYETVRQVRSKLVHENLAETTLIGFAGSPWTVACYMVEGGGSKDFAATRDWARRQPAEFANLIGMLTAATIRYLSGQIKAGAEAVQLFDSWAGLLDKESFRAWVIEPTRQIVAALERLHPGVPVIGFPRGAGTLCEDYVLETGVNGLGLDQGVRTDWAAEVLQSRCTVQGNLDPSLLLTGGSGMARAAEDILSVFAKGPFIFNLGHGVIKETSPDHVAQLSKILKDWKR